MGSEEDKQTDITPKESEYTDQKTDTTASTSNRETTNSIKKRILPFAAPVIVGISSFLMVYILTGVVVEIDHFLNTPDSILTIDGGDIKIPLEDPGNFIIWIWTTLAVQLVPIEVTSHLTEGATAVNPLGDILTTIPIFVLYVIPVFVLIPSGYIMTRTYRTHEEKLVISILGGSTFVVGYMPMVILAALLSSWETTFLGGPVTYAFPLVETIFLAGILIPLAYGSIGSTIAYAQHLNKQLEQEDEENGNTHESP